jgi:L-iditol 2-dehydrogenase
MKMKALVKHGSLPEEIGLQEKPIPEPKEDEVLLAIGATGICGTDLHIVAGEYPARVPVTLGHEMAGTIVRVGREVSGWAVGDRVTSLPFARYCGTCRHCLDGQYGLCNKRRSYGSGVDGAFAEYLAVRSSGLYRLPPNQDFVAGSLTEPLACVTKSIYQIAELQRGETAAVLGPGQIGLLAVQVAQAVGATVVLIGLQQDESRLNLGRKLGADYVFYADAPDFAEQIETELGPDGIDVAFECSGAAAAFNTALRIVRKEGRVVQLGLFGKKVEIDLDLLVFKDLKVLGSFTSSRESWDQALSLTSNGRVDTGVLVSDVLPLESWQEGFQIAAEKNRLKVVLVAGDQSH